ncbi:glycosyltransferase [uncultured Shewanella sp.]|uniref:cytidylyltransferase domain-containing protein n=1 Tax=uncultured Shewanella sp. TaxID=173975 RepID=UPI002614CEB9|nr:glycosyltransferase [uncultured Shewanella sp.]
MKVLAIIPARGGSKGIPRKNLRPVSGKPMLFYSIDACLASSYIDKIIVSTDDDEIALFAERFGAEAYLRPISLADDKTPLEPVIYDALLKIEQKYNETYDLIITVQPTSPLIQRTDIDKVIEKFKGNKFDTVQTVVDDRHLCWTVDNGKAKPMYKARVNRQLLPINYRETGAVIACTRQQIHSGSRIGDNVGLVEVPQSRSFDIDNFSDLYLCEAMLNRKKIVFTVVGYAEVGLGHAFRTVMLAHELVNYDLIFVCEKESNLAYEYIQSHHYEVISCDKGQLAETVISLSPDMVINDILDTDESYIKKFIKKNIKVVNFEDLGSGHLEADLVVNALYPETKKMDHVLTGEKYFCVRDEFLYIKKKENKSEINNILLTFGGVDEGNLTTKVLFSIANICIENNVSVTIVLGPGFIHDIELNRVITQLTELDVKLFKKTKRISDFMNNADIAITSGGRTVLELATLEIPTLVICQNERETTHSFASNKNGVVNLGNRKDISENEISIAFNEIFTNKKLREEMISKMKALDLTKGKQRVINAVISLIQ